MHTFFNLFLLIVIVLFSCKSLDKRTPSQLKNDEERFGVIGDAPAPTCEKGNYAPFFLSRAKTPLPASEVQKVIPGNYKLEEPSLAEHQFRFDICMDEESENASIVQIVYISTAMGQKILTTKMVNSLNPDGLKDALFGDSSKLDTNIDLEKYSSFHSFLKIMGMEYGGEKLVILSNLFSMAGDKEKANYVVVGKLSFGNPFGLVERPEILCNEDIEPPNKWHDKRFEFDDVKIRFKVCTNSQDASLPTGGLTYTFNSIEIDTNGFKKVISSKEDFESNFNHVLTHHGFADTFHIFFENTAFDFTYLNISEPNLYFRSKSENGQWKVNKLPCNRFLECLKL